MTRLSSNLSVVTVVVVVAVVLVATLQPEAAVVFGVLLYAICEQYCLNADQLRPFKGHWQRCQ